MKRYIFSLPEGLHALVKKGAEERGQTMSSFTRQALQYYHQMRLLIPVCCTRHQRLLEKHQIEKINLNHKRKTEKNTCPFCKFS